MTTLEAITRALDWAVETHQLSAAQVIEARAWAETQQPKPTEVIRIIVPGPVPRKNRRTRTRVLFGKGPAHKGSPRCPRCRSPIAAFVHYHPSPEWDDWVERLQLEVGSLPKLASGAWAIRIRTYTDKIRHLDEDKLHVALGDVDSPTSAVLDGLKAAGLIDDDDRFLREGCTKHVDRANPRTEVEISRVVSDVRKRSKGKRAPSGTLPLLDPRSP